MLSVNGVGKAAVLTVYTHNKPGNAVVKVYKKDDPDKTAVWSWHIWVSDYDPTTNLWDPTTAGGTSIQNVLFMDRNLGALEATLSLASRGLHYQWGRKDPFPVQDELIQFATGPISSAVDAIRHPSTFYLTSKMPNDWLSVQDDNLWNTDNKKSIYDPCPAGFRVPQDGGPDNSHWSGLSLNYTTGEDAGTIWGTSYWPAAGYRHAKTGKVLDNGDAGWYWTSGADGIDVYDMYFSIDRVVISGIDRKGYGNSVRCIAEPQP
jgi:hypothetical protein